MPALLCLFDRARPQPASCAGARRGPLQALARLIERSPRRCWPAGAAITVVHAGGRQPLRPRPVRIRFPQAGDREAAGRARHAVRPGKGRPVRPLARAHGHPGGPRRGPARAAGRHPQGRRRPAGPGRHRPDGDGGGPAARVGATCSRRSWPCCRKSGGPPPIRRWTCWTQSDKQDLERLRPPDRRCACCRPRICRRWPGGCSPRPTAAWAGCCWSTRPNTACRCGTAGTCCAIASVLQRVTLPDGRQIDTSGSAVIFAAMIRSILRDGPLATLASLAAVILLVLLRVRPLQGGARW